VRAAIALKNDRVFPNLDPIRAVVGKRIESSKLIKINALLANRYAIVGGASMRLQPTGGTDIVFWKCQICFDLEHHLSGEIGAEYQI
jgi:hypothetical protein